MKFLDPILALLALVATIAGICGDTWDEKRRGWRGLRPTGWIVATVAFTVGALQITAFIINYREELRREAAKEAAHRAALAVMDGSAEELRHRLAFIPDLIHYRHVEEAHLPQSSSEFVITVGEVLGKGRWGLARSPFALDELNRKVRLTAIETDGQPFPDELRQFMAQWTDRLNRSFELAKGDLTEEERLTVRNVLESDFLPRFDKSLADIKRIEAASPTNKTSLLSPGGSISLYELGDADNKDYLSFIDAVEKLQNLDASASTAN
jgi:hypothetical protein